MTTRPRGLTLIELLIIIVIIGIMLAVAIPKFGGRRDKERVTNLRTDVRNAQVAEDSYFDQYKAYATFAQLTQANLFRVSPGDSVVIRPALRGYEIVAINSADPENIHHCRLVFSADSTSTRPFECD